jgi:hypothetical protein
MAILELQCLLRQLPTTSFSVTSFMIQQIHIGSVVIVSFSPVATHR